MTAIKNNDYEQAIINFDINSTSEEPIYGKQIDLLDRLYTISLFINHRILHHFYYKL